jgi:hypothetical protein
VLALECYSSAHVNFRKHGKGRLLSSFGTNRTWLRRSTMSSFSGKADIESAAPIGLPAQPVDATLALNLPDADKQSRALEAEKAFYPEDKQAWMDMADTAD